MAAKKMSPKQFERSGKDNDKGVREGSKADIARDLAEGMKGKPASSPSKTPPFFKKKGK